MATAVMTRTVMANPRYLAPFAWHSLKVGVQARRCEGYLAGSLAVTSGPALWSLTVWRDGRTMNAFRNSGAHAVAMPKLAHWAKEMSFGAWQVDPDDRPGWTQALQQFAERARFPEVNAPNANQLAQVVEVPRRALVQASIPAARSLLTPGVGR